MCFVALSVTPNECLIQVYFDASRHMPAHIITAPLEVERRRSACVRTDRISTFQVTAGYYEMSAVGATVDMLGVMYLGRLVEPIWGAAEFVHFVVIVNLCVGACTFVTMYTLYIITRSQFYLFAKFSGFHGILAALMVALRQLLPEERVPLPQPLGSVLRIRNKHLPGIYCTATAALCIVSGAEHHHIGLYLFVAFGAYTGWCYLRYFQSRSIRLGDDDEDDVEGGGGGGGSVGVGRGDDSEEFAFAAQFPVFLQPVCRRLTDPCYALFCAPPASAMSAKTATMTSMATTVGGRSAGHINKRTGQRRGNLQVGATTHSLSSSSSSPMDPPGAAEEENSLTERRKELASRGAKLLEERMARVGAPAIKGGAGATAAATGSVSLGSDDPAAAAETNQAAEK